MNNFIKNNKGFLVILTVVIAVLIAAYISDIISPPSDTQVNTTQNISPTAPLGEGTDADEEIDFYADPNAQKEMLADGSIKYTSDSPVAGRPNVAIVKNDGSGSLFERSVVDQSGKPILWTDHASILGKAEQTRSGHSFYGPKAALFIYASEGSTYVADAESNTLLEIHTFEGMTVSEYLQRFKDQL